MSRALALLTLLAAAATAQTGARHLIITADSLAASIQPLADWHHAAGLPTKVVKMSSTGRDTTSIKSYIRNAYNTWSPRPEFVLLVGSAESLPARLYYYQGSVYVSSDNVYADMTGDLQAELAVGRIPAKSPLQVQEIVVKTLAYERTPDTTDREWTRRMTTIVRDAGDDDGALYWGDARYCAGLAGAAGYLACDSLASSRQDTVTDVLGSIDAGTGLVLYRGTATGNWYQPFRVNPARLTNGTRCPIVVSATCATMTLAPGESMVGQAWIKTGTVSTVRGAVAFFGNTHSDVSVANVRSAVARGFFNALFGDRELRLGHVTRAAKAAMYAQYPTRVSDYLGFNLYGDPALGVWTGTPRRLTVTHPSTLPTGQQVVDITVNTGTTPVESALVCMSMAGDWVYATGCTDETGRLSLPVNPRTVGPLRLVVTGRNLYPFDTTIAVVLSGVDDNPRPLPMTANVRAVPSAFARSTRLYWQGPARPGARLSIVDAAGRPVATLAIREGSTEAAWPGTTASGSQAPTGIYHCLLVDRTGAVLGRTRILKVR